MKVGPRTRHRGGWDVARTRHATRTPGTLPRATPTRETTISVVYLHLSFLTTLQRLAKLARFVVVPRPGQEVAEFPKPFGGQALQGWPFEVSSSTIRQRLTLGQAIDGLVPPVVAESLKRSNPYL